MGKAAFKMGFEKSVPEQFDKKNSIRKSMEKGNSIKAKKREHVDQG